MEVLHCMPDEFLRRHSARQIAEVMAYYRIKHEDRQVEEQQRQIDAQRQAHR